MVCQLRIKTNNIIGIRANHSPVHCGKCRKNNLSSVFHEAHADLDLKMTHQDIKTVNYDVKVANYVSGKT